MLCIQFVTLSGKPDLHSTDRRGKGTAEISAFPEVAYSIMQAMKVNVLILDITLSISMFLLQKISTLRPIDI